MAMNRSACEGTLISSISSGGFLDGVPDGVSDGVPDGVLDGVLDGVSDGALISHF